MSERGEKDPVTEDGGPRRKHAEVLGELLPLKGARVLDVGCGDGAVARLMTRAGARVTGIECGEEQLARARAAAAVGDEIYLYGYGEALPLADASFDIVVYFNALHHVPVAAQGLALAEARRVLKPDGLLYIQEPVAAGRLFEAVRLLDDETEVRAAAYRQIAAARARGDFEERREFHYQVPLSYDSYAAFEATLLAVDSGRAAQLSEVALSLREAFLAGAEKRDGAFRFDSPARVNLLCRT